MLSRPQIDPTDDWHQIELVVRAQGQRSYELIRPVVLFGQSPGERAVETGAAERTLYRQVARFDQLGLAGLIPPLKMEKHRTLPPEVQQAILDAKIEHPSLTDRELTRICWARCGHRPSPHTVKRILAESPQLPRTHRRFPPYHAIADPVQRRLAIVRLHIEGWNATSIAEYLETSRQTVHTTLKRWAEEEFAGLADKVAGAAPAQHQGDAAGNRHRQGPAGEPAAGRVPHPRGPGQCVVGTAPRNHGPNTTVIAALSPDGIPAAMTVEGAMDRLAFDAFVQQVLVPALVPGQTVIWDNLSVHTSATAQILIEAAGCQVCFLPPYSPDFAPIELAFSKLKMFLRRRQARTRADLDEAITAGLAALTTADAHGGFTHCGYQLTGQSL